ncbi:efflux RND transporter periplasmic adaptor subunit [Pistricoccus aurantiacus]|uniref:Efflux RND transporter periplasmic adaptor subunit n=1 Tax=Pistricoccus aurantiacus TaxID=1883414 RepID=A0A5B8SU45_9GAMM|nr:efflux RND transporter periplasmic adaptor subunit [Pistricoccus aurantiacus]QEA39507.1 efflux RND transporter periplasmic adaptor subunit [Pistricoccus aurantiacus]
MKAEHDMIPRQLLFAGLFFFVFSNGPPAFAQDAAYRVTVATAKSATFGETLETFAQVEADPKMSSTLAASVSGTVLDVKVSVGDTVAVGDLLAEITTDPVLLAQTKAAEDTVNYAREALAHQQRLFAQQLSTRDQVASAQRDVSTAEANLAAARRLGSDQSISQVTTGVSGVVSTVAVAPGQQVSQGTALVTIDDPKALLIRPGVEPADLRLIKPGDVARVTPVSAPSDSAAKGVIAPVMTIGSTVDPTTRLVPVTITISGVSADSFIVGETVKVSFSTQNQDTVSVPRSALEYDGSTPFVFRVDAKKAIRTNVTLAGSTDTEIYVSDGLKDGDTVIIGGLSGLTDGAPIEVVSP